MSFVGKFVFATIGEHCRPGQIVEQPSPDVVLVKFYCPHCNSSDHPPHSGMEAFPVADLLKRDEDTFAKWTLYETREQLDAYMEWLDGDESDEEEVAQPAGPSLN
jgi:hypothetical protein